VAVDFGPNGLWQYESSTNSWIKLNGSDPEFMVRADLFNEGNDTTLIVDFGSSIGLWYYHGKSGTWAKLSAFSPDGVS
jgi:N-acetylneuraminic acid mutarotase